MERITAKEYIAARQIKKNGDCISGDKPGGTAFFCVMALIQKLIIIGRRPSFYENRLLLSEKKSSTKSGYAMEFGLASSSSFFFTKAFSSFKDCSKTAYNSFANRRLHDELFTYHSENSATAINAVCRA